MAIEAVLLRIATNVATVGGKALVGGRRSAAERRLGLLELASARGLGLLPQRRLSRQLEQLAETIADRLQPVVESELASMPSVERELVLEGVAAALESTDFTDDVLFDANLDEFALAGLAEPAARQALERLALGEAGESFFRRMLHESLVHLAEVVITLPSFQQRSLRELLARDTEIIGLLRQVLAQMPQRSLLSGRTAEAEFEVDYRREIIRKFDRVEIFGVTVAGPTRRYPLDVAYIGLALSEQESAAEFGVEQVVSGNRYLYIRGEAGSGKTTLLRWLALRCVHDEHPGLPLMVELRRFADRELPGPSGFLTGLSRSVVERTPEGWVDQLLRSGNAVLLLDGVDEFPAQRLRDLLEWIGELVHDYPRIRFVVTSRPAATPPEWLTPLGFTHYDLVSMSRPHVAAFVQHWHAAIAMELGGQVSAEEVDYCRRAMVAAVDRSRPLRVMATNPLLCALLCALNWDRRTQLPQRRIEIYRAALEMLLRRRDHERRISAQIDLGLDYDDRLSILQDLAYWFTTNGLTDADQVRVRHKLESIVASMPHVKVSAAAVHSYLLARSGVLREPVPGRVDFIHKTFQEYLAAVRFVEDDALDGLLRQADHEDLHEVIVMAAGSARQHEAERMVSTLLDLADRKRVSQARKARLRLLAIGCSEVMSRMSADVAGRLLGHMRSLVPPANARAARILASLGEEILPILPDGSAGLSETAAAATIYTAALVGGSGALRLVAGYASDTRPAVCRARLKAWSFFDPTEFAGAAFGSHPGDGWQIVVDDEALLPGVARIRDLRSVRCDLAAPSKEALEALRGVDRIEYLALRGARDVTSLSLLNPCPSLRTLVLEQCVHLRGLSVLRTAKELETLAVRDCPVRFDERLLSQLTGLRTLAVENVDFEIDGLLRRLPRLRRLELASIPAGFDSVDQLGWSDTLSFLTLAWCESLRDLGRLHALPLRKLWILGCPSLANLDGVGALAGLKHLRVTDIGYLYGNEFLARLHSLEYLALENCAIPDLSVLRHLQHLRELTLLNNSAVPDSSTLAGMKSLRKLRTNGLARHLGPDADRYVAHLRATGVQVEADGYEDEWLFEETNEDGWADPEDLAAIGGYEDFAPIQRRAPRMRVTRR
ncbi:NACHT domain-containing protein [Actinoplanes sp. NPDC051411]|uniref:NACHT domain-containing protein n=1 Tax=Actinoplanes sp. NPDC051411 TaxID=3155522 RepID=UPI00343D7795